MKKFFFRLETLLKIRKIRESQIQRDVEYAQAKWLLMKERERTLTTQIDSLMEEIRACNTGETLSLRETYAQILEHLNDSLHVTQHNVLAQSKQIEEQKIRLRQLMQQRKVIEKIKEKHYAGWRTHQSQVEGALLDEIRYPPKGDLD